jgi:hypothetical protein
LAENARHRRVVPTAPLGLQTDYELMPRRRDIGDELRAIRPRVAA